MEKVCLVIGAGAGIGGTVAKKFASDGYHAYLARRTDEEGLNRLIKEIKNTLEVTQKQRAEKVSNNKSELRRVLEESERIRQQHKDLLRNKQIAQSMIDDDLGNLQAIDTIDKFKRRNK